MALFLLLSAIVGLVAYVGCDREDWYGSDELEVEYYNYTPSVRTEMPISSEQHEDFGINVESQQVEEQQETHRSKFLRDLEEHTMRFFEMQDIE